MFNASLQIKQCKAENKWKTGSVINLKHHDFQASKKFGTVAAESVF